MPIQASESMRAHVRSTNVNKALSAVQDADAL